MTISPSDFSSSRSRRLAGIVGDCAARLNAGEAVDIAEVASRHPELEPELGEVLRTLLALPRLSVAGPGELAGYRIEREIGRGGMGVVYEASQPSLGRRVALKVLAPGLLGDARARKRFEREASWTSRVDHPGICTIYEAGEADGLQYIAMRLVEGRTLRSRIVRERELATEEGVASGSEGPGPLEGLGPLEDRVRLIEKVARALHLAHEAGVIHRDLKPSNILVSESFEPTVVDFGLAASEEGGVSELTLSGPVGTPAYMSPEQLEPSGALLDRRTDIYSLGVSLFEVLTLEQPWHATTRHALYRQVLEASPPDCRGLEPRISSDLKIVVETALAKSPEERYQTALELADELRRVLEHRPIRARPPSAGERFRKWVRRNPVPTLSIVLLTLAAIVSFAFYLEARSSARAASSAADIARSRIYEASVTTADLSYQNGNYLEASQRLEACPEELRGVEWQHFDLRRDLSLRTISAHGNIVRSLDFSPDGSRIVSGGDDGGESHDVRIWDTGTGRLLRSLRGHEEQVWCVAFSADGSRVLSSSEDGTVRIWDAGTGACTVLWRSEASVGAAAWSENGRRLAAGDRAGRIRLWDATTLEELASWDHKEKGGVSSVAFDPDGARLATTHLDGLGLVQDLVGDEPLISFGAELRGMICAVFSSDGRRLVSGTNLGAVHTWDATSGASVRELRASSDHAARDVVCGPGGSFIAATSMDQSLCVFRSGAPDGMDRLVGHAKYVECVTASPDGETLASGSGDGTIRLWDARTRGEAVSRIALENPKFALFSPDGRLLVVSRQNPVRLVLYEAHSGQVVARLNEPFVGVSSLALSADSRCVVAGGFGGQVSVHGADPWRQVLTLRLSDEPIEAVAATPGGGRFVASFGSEVEVWDVESRQQVATFSGHERQVKAVLVTREGRHVVSGARERSVRIWELETGREVRRLVTSDLVYSLALSADGTRLAAGDDDGAIRIWSTRSWELLLSIPGYESRANGLAFSPDGSRIAAASADGSLRLWDTATGVRVAMLASEGAGLDSVSFHPSGSRLAAGGLRCRSARIYETSLPEARAYWRTSSSEVVPALFRIACVWIESQGHPSGGFPTCADRFEDGVRFRRMAAFVAPCLTRFDWHDLGAMPEGDEDLFRLAHRWAQREGWLSACPNFHLHTFPEGVRYGVIPLDRSLGRTTWVPLEELGNPRETLATLRVVSEWANREGFAAAYPTFHRSEDDLSLEVVVLERGVEIIEVPETELRP